MGSMKKIMVYKSLMLLKINTFALLVRNEKLKRQRWRLLLPCKESLDDGRDTRVSGHSLGTRTGASVTGTLALGFLVAAHYSMGSRMSYSHWPHTDSLMTCFDENTSGSKETQT